MKSRYLTPLLLVALLLAALPARAHDFEVGGIYYNIIDADAKTVAVTYDSSRYRSKYSWDISIPETATYSGITYSVTEILGRAFEECEDLRSVSIPKLCYFDWTQRFQSLHRTNINRNP